jgi:short-subunit dehydrogenase
METQKTRWAVVTGASGGMGADFARELAGLGYALILTARRRKELEAVAGEIRAMRQDARIEIIPGDIGQAETRRLILAKTRDLAVEVLVNNAGFGAYGPFDAIPDGEEEAMLSLDIVALVQLTKAFASRMKAGGRGYILETASIGAFQPCPLYASYGAAKSFVLNYGLAVREELRGSGVSLTVLCPGVTRTGFFDAAKQAKLSRFQKSSMQESVTVVRGALKSLFGRKPIHVPGLMNRMNAFMTRFVSRPLAASVARGLMGTGG